MGRAGLIQTVGLVVGSVLLAALLSRLPTDVRASTRAFLLVAASAVLLLVAGALFLLPARRLLARLFALPLRFDGARALGLPPEEELPLVLRPLVVAGVCLGVALLADVL